MEQHDQQVDKPEAASAPATSSAAPNSDAPDRGQSNNHSDSGDSDMTDSHDDSQDPNGKNSRTKRTPKQQQQNAQAQKRYRMRRKAKVQEMESAVEALTRKVQETSTLQSQNYFLATKVGQLEQALQEKEAECLQLREALAKAKATPVAVMREASGPAGLVVKQEAEDLKKSFCDSVESLKEFIQACNLRNVDATGKLVPQQILVQCKTLVQNAARVCMTAMSTETPAVLELIGKDPSRQNTIDSQIDRSRWLQVVASMRLTDDQVECILRVRREQLRKLRSLHQERCNLNQRVLETLAADRTAPAPNGTIALAPVKVVEAHMHNLSLNGFLYAVKSVLELHRLLDAVRDNLREEERVVQELTFFLVQHILSPIQAAILFVDAFPFQCDALALANALAIAARGEEESGSGDSLHSGEEGSVEGGDMHTAQSSMPTQARPHQHRFGQLEAQQ